MEPLSIEADVNYTDEDATREIRTQKIWDGTLSDKECIIELHERKAVFLDDPDWLQECRKYGENIFNQAIDRDVDIALRTGQPVIGILHLVLVHIGGLYLDNKQLKAGITANKFAGSTADVGLITEEVAREGELIVLGSAEMERESESEMIVASSDVEVEDDTSNHSSSDEGCESVPKAVKGEDAHAARLNAAIAARRKRRQLTHGASKLDDSSTLKQSQSAVSDFNAGLLEATATLPATKRALSTGLNSREQSSIRFQSSQALTACRSQSYISASGDEFDMNHISSPPIQQPSPSQATCYISNKKYLGTGRRKNYNTAANAKPNLAQSPSLASQPLSTTERQMQASPNSKDVSEQTVRTRKCRKGMLPLIDHPAALFVGGPGNKQGHNRRSILRAQQPKHSTPSNEPEPEPEPRRKKQKIVKLKVSKQIPRRTSTRQQTKPTRARMEISDSEASNTDTITDSDINIDMRDNPAKEKPNTLSPPHMPPPTTSTKSSPKNHIHTRTFPPLPSMPARDQPPFLKGAEIALDNILSDHVEDPDTSLLELIEEVEENQPLVEDWERKTIVKGGKWVCGVLRACVDETKEVVNVERLVRDLSKWVDARLRGGGAVGMERSVM